MVSAEISKTVMLTATEESVWDRQHCEKNSDADDHRPSFLDGVTATPTSGNFNISNLKVGNTFRG